MLKYFCDGCDAELKDSTMRIVKVAVECEDVTSIGATYQMCRKCCETLLQIHNPRSWARGDKRAA